jgi:hypothetical protein
MDHPIPQETEEVMNQPQPQQFQRVFTQRIVRANITAASLGSLRTVAFSLLVDRALSA